MQNANDVILQKAWSPTKDTSAEEESIQALNCAVATYSDDEIEALEDEINFFGFTGLMGDHMQEVLCSGSTIGAFSNTLFTSVSNHKAVGRGSELSLVASSTDYALSVSLANNSMRSKSDLLPIIKSSEQRPTNDNRSFICVGTLLRLVFWKLFALEELTRPAFYLLLAILVTFAALVLGAEA